MNLRQLGGVLLFATCTYAPAADDAALVDGPNYAFAVAAPKGWKLISTNELQAAFHPAGTTFEKSAVVMYVRSANKNDLKVANIAELNAFDLKGIQKRDPAAKSEKIDSIKTSRGVEVPLYSFSGEQFKEVVAYADQGKTISVLVISATTADELKTNRKAFDELVASYHFLTDETRTPKEAAKPTEPKTEK